MGKCTNLIGIILGCGTVALCVLANILEWLPQKEEFYLLLKNDSETILLSSTLPIIGTIVAGTAVIILVFDLKADKMLLKWMAISGFLASAAIMGYASGKYLYKLVNYGLQLSDNPSSETLESLTGKDENEILQILGLNSLSGVFDNFNGWGDLQITWGWAVAMASCVVSLGTGLFYACISCCGCN